ncbi:glycerophosphodiester phosphodiesterase [Streptomyces sp. B1866]|uniref:glycerophosphodiester phosphodiesterase n=1 Tax=Streptomyces sp. B1866 TaxID=3075431 RepID=UPI0028928C77|nr:glycerophosphodiester phosphodiesterase [Streptomyces sp. B1866]MDT3399742.1 glycerophosphodiester phosphodiesterase [Streptomyces sp. B1866]
MAAATGAAVAAAFTAVAHRGDPYVCRENTLPSLRSAVAAGADAVEVDVRLTQDGVPVLLHDATLKRLWGHERPLDSLTAADVRELTGDGVPSLRAALAATEAVRLLIDLPGAVAAREAVAEVRAAGAADRVYYCGDIPALQAVRAADPAAELALTWTTSAPPRPALLDALRPRWVNYRFGLISPALVDRAHADGLLVSAWTADTRRTMARLLRAGVDAVTTNRVAALRALVGGRRPVPGPGRSAVQ